MLLRVFIPAGSPQVHCSRGVGFIYKFVEFSAVPQVDSDIDLCANLFGTSYEADALQNNHLKNDHPLGIPFLNLYDANLLHECRDKPFSGTDRRYVIALDGKTKKFLPSCLPLTILVDSSIQVYTRIFMHPILIDDEECVGSGCEVNSWEVSLNL